YAAPTYLTASKATDEARMSDERPAVARTTYASVPVVMPATEASPPPRPISTLRVTTYSTAGPGTSSSTIAVARKTAYVEDDGTRSTLSRSVGGGREARLRHGRARVSMRKAEMTVRLGPV